MLDKCLKELQKNNCYLAGGNCMDECSSIVFDGELTKSKATVMLSLQRYVHAVVLKNTA